jgi:hypothetical protein
LLLLLLLLRHFLCHLLLLLRANGETTESVDCAEPVASGRLALLLRRGRRSFERRCDLRLCAASSSSASHRARALFY